MENVRFAVVGATGAVGREMISVLVERELPLEGIRLLASERSAGTAIDVNGTEVEVEELTPDSFQGIDIALFSAGGEISKKFAPYAVEAGAIVIDNSSAFRMDPTLPLVVPEVNSNVAREYLVALRKAGKRGGIIANPNCSTIQLAVVLKPLLEQFGLERVVVSTYQSVSGAGKQGMDELWNQTLQLFNQQPLEIKKFPHQIAFNCIPHIDEFLENGYTKEEMKVVNESRKILGVADLRITATAVRVPVFSCHSESVNVQLGKAATVAQVRDLLRGSPGVMVVDVPAEKDYPLATDIAGSDATFVGRIRVDESAPNAFNMWVVADNLRKGAALNAVQIAEVVLTDRGAH